MGSITELLLNYSLILFMREQKKKKGSFVVFPLFSETTVTTTKYAECQHKSFTIEGLNTDETSTFTKYTSI